MQFNNKSKLFSEENWIILPTISSTNTYAKELITKSKPLVDGTVIMAVEQTAGRGQKNNSWLSEPGKNLTFSIILDTSFLPLSRQFQINQTVCLGLFDYINTQNIHSCFIKWPNDLYIGEKKIAGILIENLITGDRHKHSIIGIGMNINQKEFPYSLNRATSLSIATKRDYDLKNTLKEILEKISGRIDQLRSTRAFFLDEDFQKNLLGIRQLRYYRHNDRIFQGIITGTNSKGELKIQVAGMEEEFGLNELFFIF